MLKTCSDTNITICLMNNVCFVQANHLAAKLEKFMKLNEAATFENLDDSKLELVAKFLPYMR